MKGASDNDAVYPLKGRVEYLESLSQSIQIEEQRKKPVHVVSSRLGKT